MNSKDLRLPINWPELEQGVNDAMFLLFGFSLGMDCAMFHGFDFGFPFWLSRELFSIIFAVSSFLSGLIVYFLAILISSIILRLHSRKAKK